MALENGPFSNEDLAPLAERAVLFCHVTTRIPDHPYDGLLTEKGGTGFPTLMVLDSTGEMLAKHAGARNVEALVKTVESKEVAKAMAEAAKLRKKAADGDIGAQAILLARRMLTGGMSITEAKEAAAKLEKASGKAKKELDQAFVYLEYKEVLDQTKGMSDQAIVAGGKFLTMAKAKRVPDTKRAASFWKFILAYTASKGDVANFDQALKMYEAQLAEVHGKGSQAYRVYLNQAEALRDAAKSKR